LYQFVWHEFCDWYLETIKPSLYGSTADEGNQRATRQVLWQVLRDTLVLLHPFAPFITEELWHRLPGTTGSIMTASFPLDDPSGTYPATDVQAESDMSLVIGVITGIRNVRGEMNVSPSTKLTVSLQSPHEPSRQKIDRYRDMIVDLARIGSLAVDEPGERPRAAATSIFETVSIFVSLEGLIDFTQESKRLEKEIGKVARDLAGVAKKLKNQGFLKKAPPTVVTEVKEKNDMLLEKQRKLKANLETIVSFQNEG